MTDHAAHQDSVKKVADLIKSIDFGMLTTLDAEGRLSSRPMSSNKKVEFDGDVWFFTYASTPRKSIRLKTGPMSTSRLPIRRPRPMFRSQAAPNWSGTGPKWKTCGSRS